MAERMDKAERIGNVIIDHLVKITGPERSWSVYPSDGSVKPQIFDNESTANEYVAELLKSHFSVERHDIVSSCSLFQ